MSLVLFADWWPVAAAAHSVMAATVAVSIIFRFILAAVIGRTDSACKDRLMFVVNQVQDGS